MQRCLRMSSLLRTKNNRGEVKIKPWQWEHLKIIIQHRAQTKEWERISSHCQPELAHVRLYCQHVSAPCVQFLVCLSETVSQCPFKIHLINSLISRFEDFLQSVEKWLNKLNAWLLPLMTPASVIQIQRTFIAEVGFWLLVYIMVHQPVSIVTYYSNYVQYLFYAVHTFKKYYESRICIANECQTVGRGAGWRSLHREPLSARVCGSKEVIIKARPQRRLGGINQQAVRAVSLLEGNTVP